MGSMICGEGRIPLSSLAPIEPLAKDLASNTKINHIVVSVTDHYNAICNDRVPSKTETGKNS